MSSRRALALLAMLCLAPTSEAGVTAERTRLVFVEGQREASLLLVNQNPYPVLVQAWVDDGALDGEPDTALAPFLPLPPVFRLEPGRQRSLRLLATGQVQARDRESLYWLNIYEIPPQATAEAAGRPRLTVTLRTQMKVLYRPHGLHPHAEDAAAELGFALLLALAGMAVLLAFTNPLTAWLTLASLLGYAALYTGFLKRATPQNIVIGGLAGAAPPLLGWVAITGHLSAEPLLLVLIIFAWTPPHFWALCIHRKDEYAKADIPMLPVTHGERYTKLHILLYTLVLFAVSLMPFVIHMSGLVYLLCALALGARFLDWAWALYCDSRPHAAIKTFKYSIVYLFLLFMALLVDHYLPLKLLL